ncbi:uncharacterized protein N7506_005109 [Penicillium brevicompactum]|uniref:uncharacterized protein n=1 Tax=Penicillium brevicompactum TaxID=5074 RepID=UPI0025424F20|nr:uncharacterized protein N7506_005109 [Penicillium brevicompactum]KAJ5337087.1 hypothetical protein N7506_005109 [Penicillium brevicompactum]
MHSATTRKTPDVFANSLRKTLEAHRAANRAGLIRKILRGSGGPRFHLKVAPDINPPVDPALSTSEDHKSPEPASGSKKRQSKRKSGDDIFDDEDHLYHAHLRWKDAIQLAGKDTAQTPWLRDLELPRASPEVILDTELRALATYLTPTAEERSQIQTLGARAVAALDRDVVPHAPIVIGSHRTGLALAHSDLDFILPFEDLPRSPARDRRPSPTRPQIQHRHMKLLRKVERALQKHGEEAYDVFLIDRLHTTLSAIQLPTTLLMQFHCGEGIPAITEYLQDYHAEYPSLLPLYAATRTLLEAHELFGEVRESLSPDALNMMIVAFLKMNHGRDQLLAFLKLYGTEIDLKVVGVAVDPPGFFGADKAIHIGEQETAQQRGQRSLLSARRTAAARGNTPVSNRLCIQDPTHYMNDLGRSCTRVSEVQSTFATAYERLRRACDEQADNPKTNSSILVSALRANFKNFESVRRRLFWW